MAYSNIRSFAKPHTSGEGGSGTAIYISSGVNTDVLNVNTLNAANITADKINANNIEANVGRFIYLISDNGQIDKIEGDELNYKSGHISDLTTSTITGDKLTINDTANIQNIINTNLTSTNIVTDYLTVNKSAHFFELIIDKIRSVQGTQINTAANCIVDFVEAYDGNDNLVDVESNNVAYYRIYWKNTDDDGRAITNDWLVYDQALCESFNVGTGVSYDVSNKYYWRLVTNTDNGVAKYVNLNTGEVRNLEPTGYYINFPNRFSYVVNEGTQDEQTYNSFDIQDQIEGEWDDRDDSWHVETTKYGLQLIPTDTVLYGGKLIFTTNKKTKLSVGVYYDDNTFEYFPSDEYKTNYSITTNIDNKSIEAFIIVSDTIEKWDACNWIDLSNTDMDVTLSGKSAIPSASDNVCQLGYRYDMLQNPTQDDISRASAIIIAAYKTPDAGIVPPSYAQYQGIGHESSYRWNLGHYRGSYFDATKAKFIGEFEVQAAGSTTPLEDYIKSFNNANPLEGFITTNNNQPVDLIVLQTDNSDKIYDLNNFPNNLQVMVSYEGNPQFDISDYDVLTLTLFGVTYDLLDAPNYTPSLPSGYQGIYVSSMSKSQYQPFRLILSFAGSEQTVTTSSMELHAEITNSGTTYVLNKSIPINSVSSVEGTDAELWQLYKDTEIAVVKQDKSLDVQLRYAVEHIVGTTSTIVTPTNMKLRVRRYKLDGAILNTTILYDSDYITTGGKTGNGYWQYIYNPSDYNWMTDQNKPIYIVVELLDSNDDILANTLVYIVLETSSALTVTNGLTESVQAHTTAITNAEGNITTLQNEYTDISQTVNSISSTVSSQQISINSMQTDISNISQTATDIGLHVTTVDNNLQTLETQIQTTGIDIEHGKITLSAANTIIDGNLSIHNADEGLVIYDNATDTPKIAIQGDTLGTLSNGNFNVQDQIETTGTFTNHICQLPTLSLGNINLGGSLQIVRCSFRRNSEIIQNLGDVTFTVNILRDSSIVQTYTGAATLDSSGYYVFNLAKYVVVQAGSYSVSITLTSTSALNNVGCVAYIDYSIALSTMMKISKDGAVFAFSSDKYAWFGSDQIRLKWGDNYISLNNDGISYSPQYDLLGEGQSTAGEIGSTLRVKKIRSGSSYNASVYDGLICLEYGIASNFTLVLPEPGTCIGKIYYVKQIDIWNTVTVKASNGAGGYATNIFIDEDDGTTRKNDVTIGGDSYWFISSGNDWIIFFNE